MIIYGSKISDDDDASPSCAQDSFLCKISRALRFFPFNNTLRFDPFLLLSCTPLFQIHNVNRFHLLFV